MTDFICSNPRCKKEYYMKMADVGELYCSKCDTRLLITRPDYEHMRIFT